MFPIKLYSINVKNHYKLIMRLPVRRELRIKQLSLFASLNGTVLSLIIRRKILEKIPFIFCFKWKFFLFLIINLFRSMEKIVFFLIFIILSSSQFTSFVPGYDVQEIARSQRNRGSSSPGTKPTIKIPTKQNPQPAAQPIQKLQPKVNIYPI